MTSFHLKYNVNWCSLSHNPHNFLEEPALIHVLLVARCCTWNQSNAQQLIQGGLGSSALTKQLALLKCSPFLLVNLNTILYKIQASCLGFSFKHKSRKPSPAATHSLRYTCRYTSPDTHLSLLQEERSWNTHMLVTCCRFLSNSILWGSAHHCPLPF